MVGVRLGGWMPLPTRPQRYCDPASLVFVQPILKIFEFPFILDQSQVCISNGLGARALQREAKMHFLHMNCKTEIGNIFTQTDAICKQKKIAMPD